MTSAPAGFRTRNFSTPTRGSVSVTDIMPTFISPFTAMQTVALSLPLAKMVEKGMGQGTVRTGNFKDRELWDREL